MRPLLLVCTCASLTGAQEVVPLTIVAPAAPGGGWDQLARTMQRVIEGQGLASRVQVENVPGAAGTVGLARFVSGRRGDPQALLITGLVMVGGVVQNASPVTLRDATPVARLVGEYEAIAVPAASPFRSLGDLLAAVRRDPGSVSWGGGSAGGTDQILVDLIARAAGIDPRRVNYVAFSGGGEARTALLGAQVSVGVSGLGEFAELGASGQVRVLAVSSRDRLPGSDVPTLREAGVDVTLANWRGVLAPPGLRPLERVRLEGLLAAMVASAPWREELRKRGWDDLWLRGDAFDRFIESETRRVDGLAALRRGAGGLRPTRVSLPSLLVVALLVALGFVLRPDARPERGLRGSWAPVGIAVLGLAANAALSDVAGFVPASAVLFAATAWAFHERRLTRVVLVAMLFAVVVFATFRYGLGVPLPVGSVWAHGSP